MQAGHYMPWFNGNGTLNRNMYSRCYARQRNFVNGYFMEDYGDSDLYDFDINKVHTLSSKPHYDVCMSPDKSMMAVEFDDNLQLYRMPTLKELGSSLSPVQALYVAYRLKEQNQSMLAKGASSLVNAIVPWLWQTDSGAEQEKKALLNSIHASLPEEFKRVLI